MIRRRPVAVAVRNLLRVAEDAARRRIAYEGAGWHSAHVDEIVIAVRTKNVAWCTGVPGNRITTWRRMIIASVLGIDRRTN